MASQDFFHGPFFEEQDFFDEGPKLLSVKPLSSGSYQSGSYVDGRWTPANLPWTYVSGALVIGTFIYDRFINTSSIDTSEIDAYRQGVELTQLKHWDKGIAKIHAGEPGHVLRRNRFGMDKNFLHDPRFEEIDYFNPEVFLRAQDYDSPLIFNIITFPIITSDNDQLENLMFDGILEPFTIRAKASFFSIDVPFEAHDVRGAVMGGNTDTTWASDLIQTVYLYDLQQQLPFLDQYADAVAFAEQEAGQGHASTIVGFFRHDKPSLAPFSDQRFPRDTVLSTNYDPAMDAALSLMTGSTEGYINLAIGKRSATAGWDYDSNEGVGTDSLTFGGMVY